ncbi:MAG: MotA/TolQ/ExbB proton channel family protein [Lentisphaeria bacterium]|nr:MotA/TolQ/ExbB proton channel family protein [Lentisphaeria bacterium]
MSFLTNYAIFAVQANGAYYAFSVSDGVGKFIVILLLAASVVTWALMIDKYYSLYKAKKLSNRFINIFNENRRSVCAVAGSALNDPSPVCQVYGAGVARLNEFYENSLHSAGGCVVPENAPKLTEAQLNAIEAVLEREISTQILELESGTSLLATIVSVCPFLGLFGTVWGVMFAFIGMAQQGSADIGAMAPGIASALLTTVVGLVVAIPSVVGYNAIGAMIRQLTVSMDNFSEGFMVKLKLDEIAKQDNQ